MLISHFLVPSGTLSRKPLKIPNDRFRPVLLVRKIDKMSLGSDIS